MLRSSVVHHLLMDWLEPYFEREFIYDNYACRPGKGTLFGIRRIKRFIAQCSEGYTKDCYILKCDISGFFMNIDRRKLWGMLAEFIEKIDFGDKRVEIAPDADLFTESRQISKVQNLALRLTEQIVMHDPMDRCHINGNVGRWDGLPPDKSLFSVNGKPMPNGFKYANINSNSSIVHCPLSIVNCKGLPIGNLTSQWFGNFYLNRLDHFVKHTLKVRYYGRYVDDFVVVHSDKEYLKGMIPKLEQFLDGELSLKLHPKKRYLQHYSKGVSFLGVTIKEGALLSGVRTKQGIYKSIYKWNRESVRRVLTEDELEKFIASVNSYWGLMRHHSSFGLRKATSERFSEQLRERTVIDKEYCKISKRKWILRYGGFPVRCDDIWRKRLKDEQKLHREDKISKNKNNREK